MSSSGPIVLVDHLEVSRLEKLQSLQVSKEWQLKLIMVGKLHDLQAELDQGYGIAVSNGSFCEGKGTAAWIIEGKDKTHCIVGVWTTPGTMEDHSSFWSELWGIYRILLTMAYVVPTSNKPMLELACNGQVVL